ncbi:Fpg/Nei family DNA glycosylase [Mucilaginibacter conchicola]|uniref:Fpg/Nei family DNA glycosylase n=1 Tax=Mucilaginibacter conchicola TaxID=2303333 RepID=A0A372NNV8_9SPHI|nr:DNA-formamidopyrimidine glycosylase family protein [Mucilaginibacter conchicola]RFZ90065.1 Fpg/Nei family DNA glycosylase [Mucilaginibacter conchicola]
MPEIPDLNIFRNNLAKQLVGQKLARIDLLVTRRLKDEENVFQDALQGQILAGIERVGKELHFSFENQHVLGLHLMLHGSMHWYTGNNENKFTIAELMFGDGTGLAITDWQKAVILTLDPRPVKVPDALIIPPAYLSAALSKSQKPIKTVLTDGKTVGGIGNAYVDEILYEAKISPLSKSDKIPHDRIVRLESAIVTVLNNAEAHIQQNFPDTISEKERDFLQVHRPKQSVTLSGEDILKIEIDKRKTYFTKSQELFD